MRKAYDWQWNPVDLPGECWKPVPRFGHYQVSNLGRVKRMAKPPPSIQREMLLTIRDARVSLTKNGQCHDVPLARIMLEAFIGPPPSQIHLARHLDDDRNNNQLSNLVWGTPKQNGEDASRNGRLPDQRGKTISEAHKAKLRLSNKLAHDRDPSIKAKHAKFVKEWFQKNRPIWVTNGTQTKRIVATNPIPEGWWRGRS